MQQAILQNNELKGGVIQSRAPIHGLQFHGQNPKPSNTKLDNQKLRTLPGTFECHLNLRCTARNQFAGSECASANREMGTKNVLVTGGLGFIGSHTVLVLLENGYSVVVSLSM